LREIRFDLGALHGAATQLIGLFVAGLDLSPDFKR
jgi:hypothetical protein